MLPYTPSLYQFLYRYNGCTNGCTGIPLVWYNLKMCNLSHELSERALELQAQERGTHQL